MGVNALEVGFEALEQLEEAFVGEDRGDVAEDEQVVEEL